MPQSLGVAATSELIARHFQYPAGYRSNPSLSGPLRCTSVGAGLLGLLQAACVFVRRFFCRESRAEVSWSVGVYVPPYREIYPRSPLLPFLCNRPSERSVFRNKRNLPKNTGMGQSINVCVRRRSTRTVFWAPNRWRKRALIVHSGTPKNHI